MEDLPPLNLSPLETNPWLNPSPLETNPRLNPSPLETNPRSNREMAVKEFWDQTQVLVGYEEMSTEDKYRFEIDFIIIMFTPDQAMDLYKEYKNHADFPNLHKNLLDTIDDFVNMGELSQPRLDALQELKRRLCTESQFMG